MLAETLLRTPFYVIGRCSLVPTSHWLHTVKKGYRFSVLSRGMLVISSTKKQKNVTTIGKCTESTYLLL
jgi:hypothetical protein